MTIVLSSLKMLHARSLLSGSPAFRENEFPQIGVHEWGRIFIFDLLICSLSVNSAKCKKIARISVSSVYLFIGQRALADEIYLFVYQRGMEGNMQILSLMFGTFMPNIKKNYLRNQVHWEWLFVLQGSLHFTTDFMRQLL